MTGIYKITSPTGKIYIGQSHNIADRKWHYKNLECQSQRHICRSLTKYGWNYHNFEVVHELPKDVSQDILNTYEILYWQFYSDLGVEMLNIREPGCSGKPSEETKQRMSIAQKTHPSYGMLNKHHSQETKDQMRKSSLGKVVSIHTREILSDINRNKPNKKNSDPVIYTFVNHGLCKTFQGTRQQLSIEYSYPIKSLHKVIHNIKYSYKGWRLYE